MNNYSNLNIVTGSKATARRSELSKVDETMMEDYSAMDDHENDSDDGKVSTLEGMPQLNFSEGQDKPLFNSQLQQKNNELSSPMNFD